MNAKFFEEQRREMIAAIRAIADHVAAQIGKTALDERVLRAMAKVSRHEFVPIEVQQYAYLNRPIPIGFAISLVLRCAAKRVVRIENRSVIRGFVDFVDQAGCGFT